MTRQAVDQALDLIAATPGYEAVARRLRRTPIHLSPTLPDRAQTGLRGRITLGPEPFRGDEDTVRVSLAGTLVHEHFHLRQNPLEKTASFWLGILARRPPCAATKRPLMPRSRSFCADWPGKTPRFKRRRRPNKSWYRPRSPIIMAPE